MKEQSKKTEREMPTYCSKADIRVRAKEVLNFIRPMELPIWQVKEILNEAARLTEWQTLK